MCVSPSDSGVLVGPQYGEDAAVIDIGHGDAELLVCKADPITFATDEIGSYAVHVNANDVAAMGARCRWFMPTVLLPDGLATESLARGIASDIMAAASSIGVAVVGGHTEVTVGLQRPIVAGAMLGTVGPGGLVTSGGALPGDALILTGGAAIEGTSVLARELGHVLSGELSEDELELARGFLHDPGISVVEHARMAASTPGVHAMHDPTEGGVATGLYELAAASDVGMVVERENVPIHELTRRLCDVLGLDPMGLIASGSLLIAIEADSASGLVAALHRAGVPAAVVGHTTSKGEAVTLVGPDGARPLSPYTQDEVARALAEWQP